MAYCVYVCIYVHVCAVTYADRTSNFYRVDFERANSYEQFWRIHARSIFHFSAFDYVDGIALSMSL